MKRINLIFRCVSLMVVGLALLIYQNKAITWAETIAENEKAIAEVEEYNKEIEKRMEEERAAAEGTMIEIEKGIYLDGTYEGSGTGYGGMICVRVTVTQGWINHVEVTSCEKEDSVYFSMAEELIYDMIDEQTPDVDVVSGATFSSKGIIEAVHAALTEAE